MQKTACRPGAQIQYPCAGPEISFNIPRDGEELHSGRLGPVQAGILITLLLSPKALSIIPSVTCVLYKAAVVRRLSGFSGTSMLFL